jgi:hypothetical protein
MANDRLWIRCACGSWTNLAKHFGGNWSLRGQTETERAGHWGTLERFLADHTFCQPPFVGQPPFTFVLESDPHSSYLCPNDMYRASPYYVRGDSP